MLTEIHTPEAAEKPISAFSHERVHIIGASGRCGAALCRALAASGTEVVALVRDLKRWRALAVPGEAREIQLADYFSVMMALKDATRVVNLAPALYTKALMAAGPEDALYVLLGCASRFTRFPDTASLGVIEGERVFLGSGRDGVILHPTLIYGGGAEDRAMQTLLHLLGRLPLIPLPRRGRALMQPIALDDVISCLIAALNRNWRAGHSIVLAGPQTVPRAEFLRLVAQSAGLRLPPVLGVNTSLLAMLAVLTEFLPGLPTLTDDSVRRLDEDTVFDITDMATELGVVPTSLPDGLKRAFAL
jgi:nucleoside-diphosphate-sugar epimerase